MKVSRPDGSRVGDGATVEPSATPIDVAFLIDVTFLDEQTFGDAALRRELLGLFVAQARRVIPTMPFLASPAQADAAHLLRGSAMGIGAWTAAEATVAYEAAAPAARAALFPALQRAFARTIAAATEGLGAAQA